MFSWLHRMRAAKSLVGITGPTNVCVVVEVANENTVVSPATGMRCAHLQWAFYHGRTHTSRSGTTRAKWRRWRGGCFGTDLRVTTIDGSVPNDMMSLTQRIVAVFPEAFAKISPADGQIGYQEAYLMKGDTLELLATVEPAGSGAFRLCEMGLRPTLTERSDAKAPS